MATLLDSIVDAVIDGHGSEIMFIELDPPCQFPHLAPSTSHKKGCRCLRCRTFHNEATAAWKRAHR